jgi:hypothetical protein
MPAKHRDFLEARMISKANFFSNRPPNIVPGGHVGRRWNEGEPIAPWSYASGINTAFYGPRIEGATRSGLAQVIGSRDNPLFGTPGGFNRSAALSPYDLYPGMHGRWVDVYDKTGKLWQHVLVGDKSFVRTGVPSRNTIEFYNALRRDVPTGAVSLRLSPIQRRATREEVEAAGRSVTINYHAPITINGTGPDMEHRLAQYHRRHIDQMRRDLAEAEYMNDRSNFAGLGRQMQGIEGTWWALEQDLIRCSSQTTSHETANLGSATAPTRYAEP